MNGLRLGIAGVGLIGGSIGLRARARGAFVTGCDSDPAALGAAQQTGAIDASCESLAALVDACDVLAICLPIGVTVDALAALRARKERLALVFDVASVKTRIADAGAGVDHFVASHPLAGNEGAGIAAADATLFEGRTWAYVPSDDAVAIERFHDFVRAMGARPIAIAAPEHDRLVALTSHLPQSASVALASLLADAIGTEPLAAALCGPGMRSMLRLARSPETLWSAIVAENMAPLATVLHAYAAKLETAANALDAGDIRSLMAYFADAQNALEAISEQTPASERSTS